MSQFSEFHNNIHACTKRRYKNVRLHHSAEKCDVPKIGSPEPTHFHDLRSYA